MGMTRDVRVLTTIVAFLILYTQCRFWYTLFSASSSSDSSSDGLGNNNGNDWVPADPDGMDERLTLDELASATQALKWHRDASLGNLIERVGALQLQVMKLNGDREDASSKIDMAKVMIRDERARGKTKVRQVARKVQDLGKLLSKLPTLLDSVEVDNHKSVESVARTVERLAQILDTGLTPDGRLTAASRAALLSRREEVRREKSEPKRTKTRRQAQAVNSIYADADASDPAAMRDVDGTDCFAPSGTNIDVSTHKGMMAAGEIWLNLEKYKMATACFNMVERGRT